MYKVLLVDDEPGALTMMHSIIDKKCTDYMISDTAENGVDALEKIRLDCPDVVITDVKMPLMDGIELVTQLRQEYPRVFSIIVSGYQEFEYAKAALEAGVWNYILKPIVPAAVQKTMEKLTEKLDDYFYQERRKIIYALCHGVEVESEKMEKYFSFSEYFVAIIRKCGLPRRFSTEQKMEIYSDVYEKMTIYGRDEMEALYIIPKELLFHQSFGEYITGRQNREKEGNQYSTCLYFGKSVSREQLLPHIRELYRNLDTVSTIGLNQTFDCDEVTLPKEIEFDYFCINYLLERFDRLLREHQSVNLKKELLSLYSQWNEEKKPQLWLEQVSRQIVSVIYKNYQHTAPLIEYEYMLEDAFFYACSMEELIDTLMEIMFKYVKEPEVQKKVDSPEFFHNIQDFIDSHITETLSLQGVCREFGVSQAYLSKLFRKYAQESFNQYLTDTRMKRAMELINRNPDSYVKDVAEMVGYSDQFYFSRIFRSYTGKSPTDYIKEIGQ